MSNTRGEVVAAKRGAAEVLAVKGAGDRCGAAEVAAAEDMEAEVRGCYGCKGAAAKIGADRSGPGFLLSLFSSDLRFSSLLFFLSSLSLSLLVWTEQAMDKTVREARQRRII